MPQFTQLRWYAHRVLRSKFTRYPNNADVEVVGDQQKVKNFGTSDDCRLDKNAILYDAFLQDSPFFEPRNQPARAKRTWFVFSNPTSSARAYVQTGCRFGGSRQERRSRARAVLDRLSLPNDFWSLAAIWAGGVQLCTIVYVESQKRERQRRIDDLVGGASSLPKCDLHSFFARLCVWPICSTVQCMRDANSAASWVRISQSTDKWIATEHDGQPTSRWTHEPAEQIVALRRISTSPELRASPFKFQFEDVAKGYLVELETKFRQNRYRNDTLRRSSTSQLSLTDLRSESSEDLSTGVSNLSPNPLPSEPASGRYYGTQYEQSLPSPPPSPDVATDQKLLLPNSCDIINLDYVQPKKILNRVDSYSDCETDESDVDFEARSSCESDSDALSIASDEEVTRSAIFRTAADFKPLDAVDIQLGTFLDTLSRDASRREHARALDSARSYLGVPATNAEFSKPLMQVLAGASSECVVEMDAASKESKFQEIRGAFARAVEHAERAGDDSMRSRILFNEAVFHELAYRNDKLTSVAQSALPEALRLAKRCYLEALEADLRNVRAAGNLAALCWLISTNPSSSQVTRMKYDRRARKYAKLAAELGDINAAQFLETLDELELVSDNDSEQRVPTSRKSRAKVDQFAFDADRFAFG